MEGRIMQSAYLWMSSGDSPEEVLWEEGAHTTKESRDCGGTFGGASPILTMPFSCFWKGKVKLTVPMKCTCGHYIMCIYLETVHSSMEPPQAENWTVHVSPSALHWRMSLTGNWKPDRDTWNPWSRWRASCSYRCKHSSSFRRSYPPRFSNNFQLARICWDSCQPLQHLRRSHGITCAAGQPSWWKTWWFRNWSFGASY